MASPSNTLLRAVFRQCEALGYLITLIGRAKMVFTSSGVLFSTESIGEEEKKVFIVRDEFSYFLRGPRFQPAYAICKSGPMLTIHIQPVHM